MPAQNKDSERLCTCRHVLDISNRPLGLLFFRLDFDTLLSVWYVLIFILLQKILPRVGAITKQESENSMFYMDYIADQLSYQPSGYI